MTTSIALFDCPHCIYEFAFDYQKIAKLNYGWRVRVRCPGCGNVVEVIMLNYTLIHGCDPDKYRQGEIVEILPPDRKAGDWWVSANTLRREILQKKSGWRPSLPSAGSGICQVCLVNSLARTKSCAAVRRPRPATGHCQGGEAEL